MQRKIIDFPNASSNIVNESVKKTFAFLQTSQTKKEAEIPEEVRKRNNKYTKSSFDEHHEKKFLII